MKKILFAAFLALAFCGACSKNKSDDDYYFKFKVNGTEKKYSITLADLDTTYGFVTLTILGTESLSSDQDYLGIYIDNSPAGGTISSGQFNDNATNYTLLTTHAKGGIEYEAGQSVASDAQFYGETITNHFTVAISSMDKTTVRGTFSGDYYADGNVRSSDKLAITDGEFNVKFQ